MHSDPSYHWLYWNPARDAFTIPIIDLSIAWYGIIFAAGFIAGYFLLIPLVQEFIYRRDLISSRDIRDWQLLATQFKRLPLCLSNLNANARIQLEKLPNGSMPSDSLQVDILAALAHNFTRRTLEEQFPEAVVTARTLSLQLADNLAWFIVIGTVIGARLGHVFFYDWPYMRQHPLEIFMIRNGGLASHGGTVGIFIALWLFLRWNRKKFPDLTFISLVDLLCIPTAFVAACIRLGNFINQEIVGVPSQLPWAVVFGEPSDGSAALPRHPVQLYEAFAYLATFLFLLILWKNSRKLKIGVLSGWFFILIFGSRFLFEFLKMPQSLLINESFIQMGQYLSLPFLILGAVLLATAKKPI